MKKSKALCILAAFLLVSHGAVARDAASPGGASVLHAPPPPPYQAQSKILAMPDFVPGYGKLFVNPRTLPTGPFLGYDRTGRLINITYMIAVKDFDGRKDYPNLPGPFKDIKVDHVSVNYQNPHPGIVAPHYHITLWLISREEQKKLR